MKYIMLFLHSPHKYDLFREKLLAAGLIVGFEIKIKNPNFKKYPEKFDNLGNFLMDTLREKSV